MQNADNIYGNEKTAKAVLGPSRNPRWWLRSRSTSPAGDGQGSGDESGSLFWIDLIKLRIAGTRANTSFVGISKPSALPNDFLLRRDCETRSNSFRRA